MGSQTKKLIAVTGAFVAIFLAFAIPLFIHVCNTHVRNTRASNLCWHNLALIDGAKQQWVLENRKNTNDMPSWKDLRPYMGRGPQGAIPKCPRDGTYVIGKVGEMPKCTYPGLVLE